MLSHRTTWPKVARARLHSSRRNRRQGRAARPRFQISNRKTKGREGAPRARRSNPRSKRQSRVTATSEPVPKVSPFANDINKEHREREGS